MIPTLVYCTPRGLELDSKFNGILLGKCSKICPKCGHRIGIYTGRYPCNCPCCRTPYITFESIVEGLSYGNYHWISPEGVAYKAIPNHKDWAIDKGLSKEDYHVKVYSDAFKKGWIRLRENTFQVGVWSKEVSDLVESYILEHYKSFETGIMIEIGSPASSYAVISVEDFLDRKSLRSLKFKPV